MLQSPLNASAYTHARCALTTRSAWVQGSRSGSERRAQANYGVPIQWNAISRAQIGDRMLDNHLRCHYPASQTRERSRSAHCRPSITLPATAPPSAPVTVATERPLRDPICVPAAFVPPPRLITSQYGQLNQTWSNASAFGNTKLWGCRQRLGRSRSQRSPRPPS